MSTRAAVSSPSAAAAAPGEASAVRTGVLYGVAAYGAWGLIPLYFKAVSSVPALQVLAHRVVWSLALLVPLVVWLGRLRALRDAFRTPRALLTLVLTAVLVASNWLVFIWAIQHQLVLQASLGYFINPLVNVLLGRVFLGERLRPWQVVSVALATIGVGYLAIAGLSDAAPAADGGALVTLVHRFPLVALVLAGTFGFYGLLRKTAQVDGLVGLTVETAVLTPAALAFLLVVTAGGTGAFAAGSLQLDGLLMLAGAVTALPLLWFAIAARRLRLTTMGFLQYLAPTGHFLCGLAFGEPLRPAYLVTFAFIWAALAIYTADLVRMRRAALRVRTGA
jgi:chloramphenicol-sensitive protein RarD